MPAVNWIPCCPRAVAVVVPLLFGLNGCAAALLPQLAATPLAQQALCASGLTGMVGPGCNAPAAASPMQSPAGYRPRSAPTAAASETVPCAQGASRVGVAGCDVGATGSIFQGLTSSLQRLAPGTSTPR